MFEVFRFVRLLITDNFTRLYFQNRRTFSWDTTFLLGALRHIIWLKFSVMPFLSCKRIECLFDHYQFECVLFSVVFTATLLADGWEEILLIQASFGPWCSSMERLIPSFSLLFKRSTKQNHHMEFCKQLILNTINQSTFTRSFDTVFNAAFFENTWKHRGKSYAKQLFCRSLNIWFYLDQDKKQKFSSKWASFELKHTKE